MERQSKIPTTRRPADRFSGDVFVDPVASNQRPSAWSLAYVHPTPCAHTARHHHALGQTRYVTEAEGFARALGGPLVRARPGDIIRIAPGEERWRPATPGNSMTHLALTEGDAVWGEHLTYDEYPTSEATARSA